MSYRPTYFNLRELVDPNIFAARGNDCWQLLDPNILRAADWLRGIFGPITVNNSYLGGSYSESGLRRWDTTTGAKFSQHKFGRALDLKFRAPVTPLQVYNHILANQAEARKHGITTVEDISKTPTWLHIDCRNWADLDVPGTVKVVRP